MAGKNHLLKIQIKGNLQAPIRKHNAGMFVVTDDVSAVIISVRPRH